MVPADTPVRRIGDRPPPGTGPYRVADVGRQARRDVRPQPALPVLVAGGASTGVRGPHRDHRAPGRGRHRAPDRRGPARASRPGRDRQPLRQRPRTRAPGGARRALAGTAPQPPGGRRPIGCSSTCGGARSTTPGSAGRSTSRPTGRASPSSRAARRSPSPPASSSRPALPGHEPYCRYTASPTARGGWTAPDMERARSARARVRPGGRARRRARPAVPALDRPLLRRAARRPRLPRLAGPRVQRRHRTSRRSSDPRSRAQIGIPGLVAGLPDRVDRHRPPASRARHTTGTSSSTRRGCATGR